MDTQKFNLRNLNRLQDGSYNITFHTQPPKTVTRPQLTLTFSMHRFACLLAMARRYSWESGYSMEWWGCTEGRRLRSSCSPTMDTSFFMRAS